MADDGMLMNFSLPDAPLTPSAVFKGGRWKDRLIARKRAQHRSQEFSNGGAKAVPLVSSTNSNTVTNNSESNEISTRPEKRQKTAPAPHEHIKASKPQGEIISSLFTSNPTSSLPTSKAPVEDTAPAAASNAPLLDGLSTFTSLGLSLALAAHLLTKLDLKAPTAIQKATITQLLAEDSDAFIQAETGSGKTLAYLLPIVQRIMTLSKKPTQNTTEIGEGGAKNQVHRDSGLFAIILAPTRELCKQISVVLDSLLRCAHWIVAGTVIGGEKKKSEKARLRKGLNILVATPGRLADHLANTEVLDVSRVRWLVLDEGDRLMELGFEEEIRGIVTKLEERATSSTSKPIPGLPARRTTVLCSATMKMNVQRLGEISLKDAAYIKADPSFTSSTTTNPQKEEEKEDHFTPPTQLQQSYLVTPAKQRLVTLFALLKHFFTHPPPVQKAIIFFSCADSVDYHFSLLTRQPPSSPPNTTTTTTTTTTITTTTAPSPLISPTTRPLLHRLHGSLPQPLRTSTLSSFTQTPHPAILLATDVASRGLDLPSLDLVIEYDPAFSFADHLHRVGRTARAGRDGRAVVFLMPGCEEGYVARLEDGSGRVVKGVGAEEVLKRGFGGGKGRGWEEEATMWQLEVERWVAADEKARVGARRAFESHVRAYATHVGEERGVFDRGRLHLGHLAKGFGLRERPGRFGVEERKGRRVVGKKGGGEEREGLGKEEVDAREVARRMRKMADRQMKGASEFNIG